MDLSAWLTQYAVAALAFCVLDFLWLAVVGKQLYEDRMGALLTEKPNVGAAILFYAVFLAGLVFFVIHPAVDDGSIGRALLTGAFFGLVTYASWDLTNLAVLRGFPASIVPIDLAWGTLLTSGVSTATYAVTQVLPSWAR